MSQIKLLKINGDGTPVEMNTSSDDITLNSYSVQGGGPVLSASGLNLNSQPISGLTNVTFVAPSTDTINQTAGNLVIDNIVAKERSNSLTTAGEVLFPVVTDTASTVDNFRIPQLAGFPTATPTNSGSGFLVWDSSDNKMAAWNGSAWQDLSVANDSLQIQDTYVAGAALSAQDVVYLSAANTVSQAKADAAATSYAMGFAKAAALSSANVIVVKNGSMSGFSALTAGARYFVSPTTAGQITATLPVGSGQSIVMVGYARSATQLDIQFQNLGRRS